MRYAIFINVEMHTKMHIGMWALPETFLGWDTLL